MIRKIGFGLLEFLGYLLMLWGGVAFGSILEGIGRYGYGTARAVDMGLIAVFVLGVFVAGGMLAFFMGNRRRVCYSCEVCD